MRKRRRKSGSKWSLLLVFLFILGVFSRNIQGLPWSKQPAWPQVPEGTYRDAVTVWYFDMGQGDASLVESGGEYLLIDTGNYEDVNRLRTFLREAGVERLDYVVGTHPHADHIGSLATVIREYEVGTLLMPEVETDTKTYQVAMEEAAKKQLAITHPAVGEIFALGQVSFQILAPGRTDFEDLNDCSIALRLSCQDTDFLWTGDAQSISEEEMVRSGLPLEAEVYQVGHHGSHTSSTPGFLEKVQPDYAVISCGAQNTYGYPHEEVLEQLALWDTKVYVTADVGTIRVDCKGNQLTWQQERVP